MVKMETETENGTTGNAKAQGYSELSNMITEIEKGTPPRDYEIEIDISQLIDREPERREPKSYKDVVGFLAREGITQYQKKQEYRTPQPTAIHINPNEIDIKELILPSLSLADQIAELERISEAIAQNVLDQRHISIVAREAYGLKSASASLPTDQADQSLISFRDMLLEEIIRKIGLVDV